MSGTDWEVETASKVALTVVAAFTTTEQAAVPLHAPPHPANTDPAAVAAVRVTCVPAVTDWLHVAPQAIPAGTPVTVPAPVPLVVTDNVALATLPVVPLTPREMASPFPVKVTFPANVPALVGENRTLTICEAPEASDNDAPAMTRNGAVTLAVTETLVLLVFWTVNVRSAVAPTATLPKLVVPDGVTVKSDVATPLADAEHGLSLPTVSTAVMRAK